MHISGKHQLRSRGLGRIQSDEGFTLIELLVVLLIIGILLAIAIPTFLTVTKGANNTAAQSNLQTAISGAKVYYTDGGETYTGVNVSGGPTSDIQQIDTGLNFYSTASTEAQMISLFIPANGSYLVVTSFAPGSNDCWGILDIPTQQSQPVQGQTNIGTTFFVERSLGEPCIASDFQALATGGFTASAASLVGFPTP